MNKNDNKLIIMDDKENKLGLSWAKLSHNWGRNIDKLK